MSRDPIIAYLSCPCCGHWWPHTERTLRAILDPTYCVCPFCAQGRKNAVLDWKQMEHERRPAVPERLDVRIPKTETQLLITEDTR